jgi:hypothetical protein
MGYKLTVNDSTQFMVPAKELEVGQVAYYMDHLVVRVFGDRFFCLSDPNKTWSDVDRNNVPATPLPRGTKITLEVT